MAEQATVASIVVTDTTEFVTIENLKIDGSMVTTAIPGAEGLIGILYRGNPGLIDTVNVTGIDVGNDAGLGMYLSGYTTPVTVTVNNSTITSYKQKRNNCQLFRYECPPDRKYHTPAWAPPLPSLRMAFKSAMVPPPRSVATPSAAMSGLVPTVVQMIRLSDVEADGAAGSSLYARRRR